ncbi:MAG: hypothetical protein Fur003_4090 [Candidatus Dojkabacteria bacterium]
MEKSVTKTDPKQAFLDAKKDEILSGSLKFQQEFLSIYQLYEAVKKWCEDDKNVICATVRASGNEHAVDVRYDLGAQPEKNRNAFLHQNIKPYFKALLGEDYLHGWDYASGAVVVK